MSREPVLVIGYGSELRSDDAAGRRVAEAIERRGLPDVVCLTVTQLTPELVDDIAGREAIYFIDARRADGEGVKLTPLGPGEHHLGNGHAGDPSMLLALTAELHGFVPRAWMLTIPGSDFRLGTKLSPSCESAVAGAAELLQRSLRGPPGIGEGLRHARRQFPRRH